MTKAPNKTLKSRMRDEGAEAAYAALMRVFAMKDASATALASAANTMLKGSGLLDKSEDGDGKEPHEMTIDEIQQKLKRYREGGSDEDDAGVFE